MTTHYLVYDHDQRLVAITMDEEEARDLSAAHELEWEEFSGNYEECNCNDMKNHLDENGNPE